MKLFPIDSDREALKKYLQDLICDVATPDEVDVLVEALSSLEGYAGFGSEDELEKRFRIAHGHTEDKAEGKVN
jgi:hypothetical protein